MCIVDNFGGEKGQPEIRLRSQVMCIAKTGEFDMVAS